MKVVLYGPFLDHQIHLANAYPKDVKILMLLPLPEMPERTVKMVQRDFDTHLMRVGGFGGNLRFLVRLLESWKRIRAFRPDVVHLQLGGGWTEIALLPALMGYPLVVTFHDVESHPGEGSEKASFARSLLAKRADRIIVHGEVLRGTVTKQFSVSTDKVEAIPLGAPELDSFKVFERVGVREEGNLILFFGRIFPYKGLDYLIKAEPLISKEVPGAKIIIAGAGEDFGRYQQMMAGREDKYVILNRRIPFEEGAELFQKCSVVVLPCVEASQSGIVPIAYGFKKPVVVTNVGGLPEVVADGETGFVVPPRDSQALADAVVKLLKDRNLRKDMGERGNRYLSTSLSWDEIATRTLKVYEDAIGSKKS